MTAIEKQELGERMNRRERLLVSALEKVADSADDDIPLFWFKKVLEGWIKQQSKDRKFRLRSVFVAAAETISSEQIELPLA